MPVVPDPLPVNGITGESGLQAHFFNKIDPKPTFDDAAPTGSSCPFADLRPEAPFRAEFAITYSIESAAVTAEPDGRLRRKPRNLRVRPSRGLG